MEEAAAEEKLRALLADAAQETQSLNGRILSLEEDLEAERARCVSDAII